MKQKLILSLVLCAILAGCKAGTSNSTINNASRSSVSTNDSNFPTQTVASANSNSQSKPAPTTTPRPVSPEAAELSAMLKPQIAKFKRTELRTPQKIFAKTTR